MNKETRLNLSVALVIFGCVWLLFELIWLPPALMILGMCMNGYPRFVEQHFAVIYIVEALLSLAVIATGAVLIRRNSK